MASKWQNIRLSEQQDRRIKLTSEKKIEILRKYQTGTYSLRKLAREYNVSLKTILLIVNEESKAKNDEYIKNHWMNYKQDREERAKTIRKVREYKRRLYQEGKLK